MGAPNNTIQDSVQEASLKDRDTFWDHHAQQLHWHKPYSKVLSTQTKTLKDGTKHPHWSWFPDGEISTTYNCIHRHVEAGNGENVAMIWESPVTNSKEKYTYNQIKEEVETLAGVLREEGVKKGDMVLMVGNAVCTRRSGFGTCTGRRVLRRRIWRGRKVVMGVKVDYARMEQER